MKNIIKDPLPTTVASLCCEQIRGGGEDGFAYAFNESGAGFIATFDGCGGMGAKKYKSMNDQSGAKIASALAGLVFDSFFAKDEFRFDGTDAVRLQRSCTDIFRQTNESLKVPGELRIGGNLFKAIPTTAVVAATRAASENEIECEFLWAGDSRGYILDSKGIAQITTDDLETEEDAFSNLRNDSKLSNVLNGDHDFVLHERILKLKAPVMVISATDGSFGYFSTPMEFEHALLRTLADSADREEWQKKLEETIRPYSGDDYTIVTAVYGFDSFEECKAFFAPRLKELEEKYTAHLEGASEEELFALWQSYKTDYYRWWNNK